MIATAGGGIETVYELTVSEAIKGPFARDGVISITEAGGSLGGRHTILVGAPRYEPGREYLVFAEAPAAGQYHTVGLGLGQCQFASDRRGQRYVTRPAGICGYGQNLEPHEELDRKTPEFLEFVKTTVRGGYAKSDYFTRAERADVESHDVRAASFTRKSYVMNTADVRTVSAGRTHRLDSGLPTRRPMSRRRQRRRWPSGGITAPARSTSRSPGRTTHYRAATRRMGRETARM